MHPEHKRLLKQIRDAGEPPRRGREGENDSYTGSKHLYYNVSVPERRAIAKAWLAAHKGLPHAEVIAVVESLLQGESHEEKTLAAIVLGYHSAVRRELLPSNLERWLELVHGWAEVDSFCQSLFPAEQLLGDFRAWRALIKRLSRDSNINKRRAAIVLLTGPVHRSEDPRLHDLALEIIEALKAERPILITKAISWLLRSMVTHHRQSVIDYLDANAQTLPKIAIRETRVKLTTGRKNQPRGRGA